MTIIELSKEQEAAIDRVLAWQSTAKGSSVYTLGGYAGCGKTTVLQTILKRMHQNGVTCAVAAFTGKAVSVLRRKGLLQAMTLHRLMYEPEVDEATGKVEFIKKDYLGVDLVIVDEASMVNQKLFDDLLSFSVPILAVGDHGQLEPVGADPGLMKRPDVTLTTIHRQSEGSPILTFAHRVRENQSSIRASVGIPEDGEFELVEKADALQNCHEFDQVLCGFNRTRTKVNKLIRQRLGRTSLLEVGDRVICLRNNADLGVFNGLMGTVTHFRRMDNTVLYVDIEMEDGTKLEYAPISREVLEGTISSKDLFQMDRDILAFDYGYCVTVHKAQGSEWDRVLVLEETSSKLWDSARWRYTAATRAAQHLTWAR